jgi:hypothetical protein
MVKFNLIGLYQIVPTLKSLILAARFHGYDWLLKSGGEFSDEIEWNGFQHLGLLEFQVFGEYSPGDLLSINQNNQSPYLEFYLDPKGVEYLNEYVAVKTDGRRVCFFLHFIDISSPLHIGEDEMKLPTMSQLPDRLVPFTHYVPVD